MLVREPSRKSFVSDMGSDNPLASTAKNLASASAGWSQKEQNVEIGAAKADHSLRRYGNGSAAVPSYCFTVARTMLAMSLVL
jgi:hypothetical protein